MKIKISFVLLLICALFGSSIQAQNNVFVSDLFRMDEYIKRQDKFVNYEDTESYIGTPYNHPSFLNGNIYKNNELLATNVAIRYNAVADEIEVKESLTSPDSEAKLLTKAPEIFVKIMDDLYIFAPYQGGVEGGGYFEVLFEGDRVDLYKKLGKSFKPAKPATSSITRDVPAKFSDDITYYLADKNGKFFEMPNSRNKKLKVFGTQMKQVKSYVKENGLDLNEENDLLKAVKFYDKAN